MHIMAQTKQVFVIRQAFLNVGCSSSTWRFRDPPHVPTVPVDMYVTDEGKHAGGMLASELPSTSPKNESCDPFSCKGGWEMEFLARGASCQQQL